jgi:hypothetical protein
MPIEIGQAETIFRYPVKSMARERLEIGEHSPALLLPDEVNINHRTEDHPQPPLAHIKLAIPNQLAPGYTF